VIGHYKQAEVNGKLYLLGDCVHVHVCSELKSGFWSFNLDKCYVCIAHFWTLLSKFLFSAKLSPSLSGDLVLFFFLFCSNFWVRLVFGSYLDLLLSRFVVLKISMFLRYDASKYFVKGIRGLMNQEMLLFGISAFGVLQMILYRVL
jgi:hypothetical protein